jgi:type VI secretion system protein VasG
VITSLQTLLGKLNTTCRVALQDAAGLCINRTHYEIDLEHWLLKILEKDNTDLHAILRHLEIGIGAIEADLNASLDEFKKGNARRPDFSPNIPKLVEIAWLKASVDLGSTSVRSGDLLLGALLDPELTRLLRGASRQLQKIDATELAKTIRDITANSSEAAEAARTAGDGGTGGRPSAGGGDVRSVAGSGKTPSLDQFCVNLTQRARDGKIDPVLGRDAEIRQMIDILTRRRQNNPILTGEAGVGKTAVVEGLALKIAAGDVPKVLQGVLLYSLDLGLLQAGASVKGEFENRLRGVIDEVKSSPTPIIMFIDEAHTLIGAGGQAGQNDAANLLKPALARGEMRTIAATTWSEFKKYFEKDPALARRFQVVKVEEPDEATGISMLRGMVETMEKHHGVRILDEAVADAVRLSNRYITGRQLPDKAVSVLDTACARVNLGLTSKPGEIEDAQRWIEILSTEVRVLERETAAGGRHGERLAELRQMLVDADAKLATLTSKWDDEHALVTQIREKRAALEADVHAESPMDVSKREALAEELANLSSSLAALQGDMPLMSPVVDAPAIGAVISAWTGIPLGSMVKDEMQTVLKLGKLLEERVIGQPHALHQIAQRIKTSRAKLEDPNKPIGVFLLVGTSGVGKTETALSLADILYGGERNMVAINMSEFQEAHTVSSLKGSPPGYVGYGEGGVLTEAVRRKPYSVVLLDEIEKAHPDVLELFFQVFDKGVMDDAEGREINFKNTVIILTSNAGTDTIMRMCTGEGVMPAPEEIVEAIRPELNHVFKPAFLGRTTIIPFYPLASDVLETIIRLKVRKIQKRTRANHRAELAIGDDVIAAIAARCNEPDSGARNIDNIISGSVLPQMSEAILERIVAGGSFSAIEVTVDDDGRFGFSLKD